MDVIRSGLEACPWGLNGYGFDQYVALSPGNAVLALARYWLDQAATIAYAEQQHPGSCYRVRYEDLVTEPEEIAGRLFEFLGVAAVPGICHQCFSPDRERSGPADYKIWNTSRVTRDSVGLGERIPVGLLPPPEIAAINDLLDRLGYIHIDEKWGTPQMPSDLRATASPAPAAGGNGQAAETGTRLLGDRLQAGMARLDDRFAHRWRAHACGSFTLVSRPLDGGDQTRWRADLVTATVTTASNGSTDDGSWSVVGSPDAWNSVLLGQVNLAVAFRRCDLRYCHIEDSPTPATEQRLAMLADLLGLTSWDLPAATTARPPAVPSVPA